MTDLELVLEEGKLGKENRADNETGKSETSDPLSHSAQVLNVAQKALLSSGFDTNESKNVRFFVKEGEDRTDRSNRTYSVDAQGEERTGNGLERTQTDSAAFKRWFGDSKVVDEDGKPLVVYHGTIRILLFSILTRHKRRMRDSWGRVFISTETKQNLPLLLFLQNSAFPV